MRFLVYLAIAILALACNPDRELIQENEQLKTEITALKIKAEQAMEKAVFAQAEAEKQAEMAQYNLLMANELANKSKEEIMKLKSQLKNCK